MTLTLSNLVGGKQVPAHDGRTLDLFEPATGALLATIPRSGASDVADAVNAARSAYEQVWSRVDAKGRARHIRRLADVTEANADELAELESRDTGRVITETRYGHLPGCVDMFHFFAGAADKIHGDTVNVSRASLNFTLREPLGVVGLVLPWNSPMSLVTAKVGAALAAGNTVVVKPAEQACASVLRWAELVTESDFPPGVINVVAGLGEEAGEALVTQPGVARISFTGSTETARRISVAAAGTFKQLHLELGGKSPNIVFGDADLEAATLGVTTSGVFTGNAGQSCIAGSRILVHRSVVDELLERITAVVSELTVGNPMDPATKVGAIVTPQQHERVMSYITSGRDEGAELLIGGGGTEEIFPAGSPLLGGSFVQPTLFRTADQHYRIAREEIFGPVGVLIPFDTDEEALSIANASDYGLAAGVWTTNLVRAHKLIRDLAVGNVWVNAYPRIHWALPFGGVKDSGYGRDSGLESILENTQTKTAWIDLPEG
jgi:(Z)-2-((N-methylformamido)methylene)-5-hydroxybutyrolactone dehydrogenase